MAKLTGNWNSGTDPDPRIKVSLYRACELIWNCPPPLPDETVEVTPEFAALIFRLEGADLEGIPVEQWPWRE